MDATMRATPRAAESSKNSCRAVKNAIGIVIAASKRVTQRNTQTWVGQSIDWTLQTIGIISQ